MVTIWKLVAGLIGFIGYLIMVSLESVGDGYKMDAFVILITYLIFVSNV